MKAEINLLPFDAKAGRIKRIYQRRAMRLYVVGVSGLLLIMATYGSLWWAFQRISSLLEQPLAARNGDEITKQVQHENTFLRAVQQEIAGEQVWLPLTSEVLTKAPRGIVVTSIELKRIVLPTIGADGQQQIEHALAIGGRSDSRSAVVDYEQELQSLKWVGKVEAPLRNLANGEAISFSFTLFKKKDL